MDGKGENSIAEASEANARLSPQDVDAAADIIKSADILLMQLEIPLGTVAKAAGIAVTDVPSAEKSALALLNKGL